MQIGAIKVYEMLQMLIKDETGLATVEYVLLTALLVAGLVLTWRGFGCTLKMTVARSSAAFDTASAGGLQ